MEQCEEGWGRERMGWGVGVGAAASVDATLQPAQHWAELAGRVRVRQEGGRELVLVWGMWKKTGVCTGRRPRDRDQAGRASIVACLHRRGGPVDRALKAFD